MADTIGKLLKSEGDSKEISPAKSQKKLKESKRRLGGVCRSLLIDTAVYEPKKTVNSINAYIAEIEKVDRLLYSVISGFIVGLDEKDRGIFSTNVDKLLQYVLDEANSVEEDTRKICIKLYDHCPRNIIQIESASVITKDAIANAMKDEVQELHKEIKGIQKEYITILGIFAAIMLAFVGAFTFSTSVLSNLGKVDALELVMVVLVIGLVFVLLISILIEFLREINDKVIKDEKGKRKWSSKSKIAIGVLMAVATITIAAFGISKMSVPQQISFGKHIYQLVDEESMEKKDVDSKILSNNNQK